MPTFDICAGKATGNVTAGEIEQANMVIDPLGVAPNLPFGHLHAVWVEFREGHGGLVRLCTCLSLWGRILLESS